MVDIRTKAKRKGIRLTRDDKGKRVKKTNEMLQKEINTRDLAVIKNRVSQAAATMKTCKQLVKNQCSCASKRITPVMRRTPPPPPPPPPAIRRPNVRGPAMPRNLLAQLQKNLNRRGLRQIANRNAKATIA